MKQVLLPRSQHTARSHWPRVLVAFMLALIAHVSIVFVVFISPRPQQTLRTPPDEPILIRPVSAAQWEKNRTTAQKKTAETTEQLKQPKRKKQEKIPKGQIVDLAPGNDEIDPNAKYIAETNNKAQKQTRAREQTAFYRNAMPYKTAPKHRDGKGNDDVAEIQSAGSGSQGAENDAPQHTPTRFAFEVPTARRQQAVAMKTPLTNGPGIAVPNRAERNEVRGNSQRLNISPGIPSLKNGKNNPGRPGMLHLLPSPKVVDAIIGAAANDYLRDVEEGDGTYLSSREWLYASFFNRVKKSISQQWKPGDKLRLRDPTGNLYGGKDRYTLLAVTLDGQGRLKTAYVKQSSGLDFLDLEAIHAFERAQPFPNPPPGILSPNATVQFQFGFFLEMTGHPGLRLFRYAH